MVWSRALTKTLLPTDSAVSSFTLVHTLAVKIKKKKLRSLVTQLYVFLLSALILISAHILISALILILLITLLTVPSEYISKKVHLPQSVAHIRDAALQKQWSLSKFLNLVLCPCDCIINSNKWSLLNIQFDSGMRRNQNFEIFGIFFRLPFSPFFSFCCSDWPSTRLACG